MQHSCLLVIVQRLQEPRRQSTPAWCGWKALRSCETGSATREEEASGADAEEKRSPQNSQWGVSGGFADLSKLPTNLKNMNPNIKRLPLIGGMSLVHYLLTSKSMMKKEKQTKQTTRDTFLKRVTPPQEEPRAALQQVLQEGCRHRRTAPCSMAPKTFSGARCGGGRHTDWCSWPCVQLGQHVCVSLVFNKKDFKVKKINFI